MKYGFTAYEAQALGPHIVLKEERKDYTSLGAWMLVLVLGVLWVTQSFLLPMTVAHADTKVSSLSDRQQETLYCRAWKNGTPVVGGTESAIATHCKKYL